MSLCLRDKSLIWYTNPEAYEAIKKVALEITGEARYNEVADLYTKHFNGISFSTYCKNYKERTREENINAYFEKYDKISLDNVEEEVVAKRIMNEPAVLKLYEKLGDRSLWEEFSDTVKVFIDRIKGKSADTDEATAELTRQTEQIAKYIATALKSDSVVERYVEANGVDAKRVYEEREKGKNEKKYLFAGEKARTANLDSTVGC